MILQRHAIRVIFLVCKKRFLHQKRRNILYDDLFLYFFFFQSVCKAYQLIALSRNSHIVIQQNLYMIRDKY